MESRPDFVVLPVGMKEFWMFPASEMEQYIYHMPAHDLQTAEKAVIKVEKFYRGECVKMTPSAEQMKDGSALAWCNEVVECLGVKASRAQHAHMMSQIYVNCMKAFEHIRDRRWQRRKDQKVFQPEE